MTRPALAIVLAAATAALGCSDDGADGMLPCTTLVEDVLNANAVYTADGDPVVLMRLDLAGTCGGTGVETFVIYRSSGIEITTDPTAIDPMMLPESDPGEFSYLYRTQMLTIEIRRASGADVTLAFLDGSAMPPAYRCQNVDGFLTCDPI